MAVHRCPHCSIPCLDVEFEQGVCPGCNAPLLPSAEPPRHGVSASAPTVVPARRWAMPFLLGLFAGCLIGLAGLWTAVLLGTPLPGGWVEQTAAFQAVQTQKAEADNQVREAEIGRQAAESGHAESLKTLEAANRKAAAGLKQKEDAEKQLHDALARLTEEQKHRASLEKTLAEEKKAKTAPKLSFVRDWQLLGPFPSNGEQGHDTVYPPEREPVQLDKAYSGFGGRQVKWRPYYSPEDKIDLARFFQSYQPGVAFAVSWAYVDADQAVTLGVGSDDGIRLWINGQKVHDVKGGRQARAGQDAVRAHLKKGWNEIRAKVDNVIGTWELYVEFRTADGHQPLKLLSTCSPPPAPAR